MASAAPRRQTCPNCSKEFLQPVRPGRPNTYCSAKCTAEGRHKAPDPPDHSQHDADLLDIAMDFHLIANALLADAYDNAGSAALLAHHAQLTRQLDHLEAVIVGRGRAQGESWEQLSSPRGLSAERLRKKWPASTLKRRLDAYRAARARPAGGPLLPSPRRPGTDDDSDTASSRAPTAHLLSHTPLQQLSGALSHLQRLSGKPLKETAAQARISPSHLSRLLAGQRRPSWPVTERLVTACQGDLAEVQVLWEAAHRPAAQPCPPPPEPSLAARRQFHTAVRGLYLAADRPDLWTVQAATSNSLSINHIARTLSGPHIPDWYTASRLVFALHGRPADFRALWHTAARTPIPACAAPDFALPAGAFG
ncbi:helix-turn-helix domain-containing protein [Streptomyces sp. NPDC055808]